MPEPLRPLVERVYTALAAGDAATLDELLGEGFVGEVSDGMPYGLGGRREGSVAMREQTWWPIGRRYRVRPEPQEWIDCADGRLLVLGRYRGAHRESGGEVDAAFAHLWTAGDGTVAHLVQITDTARWAT
ncbi:MAG TPA: nuclear transport factor 2 family protein [Solirubrobacteraceae bacterium]|nr:nuclear transport factor 2 family protein [Solirubrobacteraceae bacterium]